MYQILNFFYSFFLEKYYKVIKIEEEIELYNINEEEDESPITINGDIFISVNNYGGKINLKKIRSKITKPLKNKIKERDSKTCLCCGKKFKNHLEVHHIMPISKYPDLATTPENLASLCQKCHARYHDLYKGEEGAVSFAIFLKQYGVK